jgi:hypothetical protein
MGYGIVMTEFYESRHEQLAFGGRPTSTIGNTDVWGGVRIFWSGRNSAILYGDGLPFADLKKIPAMRDVHLMFRLIVASTE